MRSVSPADGESSSSRASRRSRLGCRSSAQTRARAKRRPARRLIFLERIFKAARAEVSVGERDPRGEVVGIGGERPLQCLHLRVAVAAPLVAAGDEQVQLNRETRQRCGLGAQPVENRERFVPLPLLHQKPAAEVADAWHRILPRLELLNYAFDMLDLALLDPKIRKRS